MYCKPVEKKKKSTMWLGMKCAALKSNVLICIHYAWWFSLLGVYDKWREHRNNPLSICAWAINTYYCVQLNQKQKKQTLLFQQCNCINIHKMYQKRNPSGKHKY